MLGPRIAALRTASGLSQAGLAKLLLISPSAVGMYEQGRREPSVDTLVQMSRIFGVTTDFLLTGSPGTPEEANRMEQLLSNALQAADPQLEKRRARPFSRQELTVLLAAMLTEP